MCPLRRRNHVSLYHLLDAELHAEVLQTGHQNEISSVVPRQGRCGILTDPAESIEALGLIEYVILPVRIMYHHPESIGTTPAITVLSTLTCIRMSTIHHSLRSFRATLTLTIQAMPLLSGTTLNFQNQ